MIGQKELREQFENFNNLPKTVLFIGNIGSGRKTFAYWVAHRNKMPIVVVESNAESIRELSAVRVDKPTAYVIADIEQLSVAAQNSLLKILEETPDNMYFMLTALQEDLVLPTITSRCFVYRMCNYSRQELSDYIDQNYNAKEGELNIILDICTCPGEINSLMTYDIAEFMNYVQLVYDNIAKVSGANSFKIGSKVNMSDDTKKYDLGLFWRAFMCLCMKEISIKNISAVRITSDYYADLRIKGLNKQIGFYNWSLDIRKAWYNADN